MSASRNSTSWSFATHCACCSELRRGLVSSSGTVLTLEGGFLRPQSLLEPVYCSLEGTGEIGAPTMRANSGSATLFAKVLAGPNVSGWAVGADQQNRRIINSSVFPTRRESGDKCRCGRHRKLSVSRCPLGRGGFSYALTACGLKLLECTKRAETGGQDEARVDLFPHAHGNHQQLLRRLSARARDGPHQIGAAVRSGAVGAQAAGGGRGIAAYSNASSANEEHEMSAHLARLVVVPVELGAVPTLLAKITRGLSRPSVA
jgi:hypothetical protein